MVVVLLVIFHDLLLPCDQRSNSVHQVLPIHQHLGSEALVDPGLLGGRRKEKEKGGRQVSQLRGKDENGNGREREGGDRARGDSSRGEAFRGSPVVAVGHRSKRHSPAREGVRFRLAPQAPTRGRPRVPSSGHRCRSCPAGAPRSTSQDPPSLLPCALDFLFSRPNPTSHQAFSFFWEMSSSFLEMFCVRIQQNHLWMESPASSYTGGAKAGEGREGQRQLGPSLPWRGRGRTRRRTLRF